MSIFSNINEDNERQSQNPDIPQGQNIPYNQGTQDEEEPLDEEDLDEDEVFDDDLDNEEEWEEYRREKLREVLHKQARYLAKQVASYYEKDPE